MEESKILLAKKMGKFVLLVFAIYLKLATIQAYEVLDHEYNTTVLIGNYSENITVVVDVNKEYIIHFPDSFSKYPYTVSTWSDEADTEYPVFVMVRQQKEPTSWKIPLPVKSLEGTLRFYNVSRTLCHNNINVLSQMPRNITHSSEFKDDHLKILKRLSLSISTSSEVSTPITIRVEEQEDFFVAKNQNLSFTISPSKPRYFYFKYPDNNRRYLLDTVILDVDSQDDTCLLVSIQNASCPVFDLNEDIENVGEFETIDTRGGLIINQKDFPKGFFVVFVAKGDDFDCVQKGPLSPSQRSLVGKSLNRTSAVSFKINPNISESEYWTAFWATMAAIAVFYIFFILFSCGFCCWRYPRSCFDLTLLGVANEETANLIPEDNSDEDGTLEPQQKHDEFSVEAGFQRPSTSNSGEGVSEEGTLEPQQNHDEFSVEAGFQNPSTSNSGGRFETPSCSTAQGQEEISRVNSAEGQNDRLPEESDSVSNASHVALYESCSVEEIDALLKTPNLRLTHLAKKSPRHFHRESCNYMWHVLSVGIFYMVPVVQLAVTQQMILNETGNLDTCYYNFLCAHPFVVNDFNHVFSNVAYLFAGILFFGHTVYKQSHNVYRRNFGIPPHYGLYYAMSAALFMEGVLSACYHVCPTRSSFQFDTSFMYVMAVLCIVKLYQNRHPDINARAHATFMALAVALVIVVVGILDGNKWVWIAFIECYTGLILYLAFRVYFLHSPVHGATIVHATRKSGGIREATRLVRKGRCILVIIATLLNIIVVHAVGYSTDFDFATFMLILLMGNAFLYTLMYTIMKFVSRECVPVSSIIYAIFAVATWSYSVHFFLKHASEWGDSAAKSRERNTHCTLMNFYDNHDEWHLVSAVALFFSFMLLSTIDDNIKNKPFEEIDIF